MKLALVLFLILSFMAAFVLGLVWTLKSPGNSIAVTVLIIICIAECPAIMLGVFHGLWRPVAKQFPEREHGPDAVTRNFQSFGLGIINMGLSIHATVDASYLHVRPVTWLRVMGASPMSIPWESMTPTGKRGRAVRLDNGTRLDGPKWCFKMLNAADSNESKP